MPYGVSNSFKRGTMRTYGGQRVNRTLLDTMSASSDKPRVRISMDENGHVKQETIYPGNTSGPIGSQATPITAPLTTSFVPNIQLEKEKEASPSSPVSRAIFSEPSVSDHTHITSASPPSSPPQQKRDSPPFKTRKPAFNFLKRKRSSVQDDSDAPLTETNANSSRKTPRQPAKRTRLTQMQLDLGGDTRQTCRDCGMEYVPSNREDAKLHGEFHAMNVGGVGMGTGFAKESKVVERWGFGEVVAMIDSRSATWLRKRTKRVLDVVRADLGAVEISEFELWGRKEEKTGIRARGESSESKDDRQEGEQATEGFKALLYLAGDKCVGLCLAERIRRAEKVVKKDQSKAEEIRPSAKSSCIQTETSLEPMLMGISRIWVSKSHRRKGIAQTLLDSARANFFYGIDVPKKMVAFSQPTESGGYLAETWFGEQAGWHVYRDSH